MLKSLILNVSLLVALSSLYSFLSRPRTENKLWVKIVAGVMFGVIVIAGMNVPYNFAPGVFFDGRSIVMVLVGLFGGGVVTLISSLMALVYRISLGGAGIYAGIATIASTALVGLTFRKLVGNKLGQLGIPGLYGIGLCAHLVMLACQLLVIPWPNGLTVIKDIWLPILLIFPVATVVMGVLLRSDVRRVENEKLISQSEERHRMVLRSALDGFWRVDLHGHILEANEAYCQMTGYDEEDLRTKTIADVEADENPDQVLAHIQRVKQEGFDRFETHQKRKDGSIFPIEASIRFLPEQKEFLFVFLHDLTDKKQSEVIVSVRLRLIEYAAKHSVEELMQKTIDEVEAFTNSSIGFFHIVDDDQESITLQAWSTRTKLEFCKAEGNDLHCPVNEAGVWADCIRQRKVIIHNNYEELPDKKGLPEGHAEVKRELVVPISVMTRSWLFSQWAIKRPIIQLVM
jgi:PAS domain S-box-containing protein